MISDLEADAPHPAIASDAEPYELRDVAPLPMGAPAPPPPSEAWPIGNAPVAPAAPAAPVGDPALARRIGELEAHIKDQDEALRRVLSLLVDWVEGDSRRPDISPVRGTAA